MGSNPTRAAVAGAALAGVVFLALVVGSFVASEQFIYYWDFSGYWIATIRLGDLLDDPAQALSALVESVRNQKYNLLPAVPLAPISRLFDHDRTGWVLTVLIVYGLPALVALGFAAVRLGDGVDVRGAPAVAVSAAVLLPALWAPLLRGSVGIGGVTLAVVVWLSCVFPLREVTTRRVVLWGVLLAALILFRRWYGFWVVSWVIALGIEALIEGSGGRDRYRGLRVVAAVAALVGVVLLVVATPIALRMLTTDPAASRAAYRAAHFYLDGLGKVVGRFGVTTLAFAAAGLVIALRNPATRSLARALAWQTAATLLIFLRAQPFDRHHYYLIAPQVAVFSGVLLIELTRRARDATGPRVVRAGCLAILAVGFVAAFYGPMGRRLDDPWALFAKPRFEPQSRDDLAEIVKLSGTLDELTRADGGQVYVLSSYWLLNEDILRNAHLTTDAPDIASRVLLSAHIDRKEGFPHRLMQADYAVVTNPPRVHLRPTEQEVIVVPAQQILDGAGIGKAFRLLPHAFTLQDGTEVSIYERTGPIRPLAKRALRERLERDLSAAP